MTKLCYSPRIDSHMDKKTLDCRCNERLGKSILTLLRLPTMHRTSAAHASRIIASNQTPDAAVMRTRVFNQDYRNETNASINRTTKHLAQCRIR